MKFMLILLVLHDLSVFVQSQKVTLFEYRREDSETNCTHGLISDVDEIVFQCQVNFTQNSTSGYVTIFILRNNNLVEPYFTTEDHHINGSCKNTESITCKMIDTYTFHLTVRFKASLVFSGARIRGKLTTSDNKVTMSEDQQLPMITDSRNTNGFLVINDYIWEEGKRCDVVLNDPELRISYICASSAGPCMVEISTDDPKEQLRGKDIVVYKKVYENQNEIDVHIKYAACSFVGRVNTITCHIRPEFQSTPAMGPLRNHQLLVVFLFAVPILLTFLSLVIYTQQRLKNGHHKTELKDWMSGLRKDMKEQMISVVTKKYTNVEALDFSRKLYKKLKDDSTTLMAEDEFRNNEDDCKKYPGHRNFVEIKSLSLDHLPEDHRDQDVLGLIQAIANITVKVIITPDYSEGPNLNNESGRKHRINAENLKQINKFGTGIVTELQKILGAETTTCGCNDCKRSGRQNKVAGKILIATASAVVSNDNDARKSKFEISYEKDVGFPRILCGTRVAAIDNDNGFCVVECETCSGDLLAYLVSKRSQCQESMSEVNKRYQNSSDEHKLCVIVSHPHGSLKQVSFGKWIGKNLLKTQELETYCRYEYTTSTCPGSAGAFVYILGVGEISRQPHHLHWGVGEDGINYSSTGVEIATQR